MIKRFLWLRNVAHFILLPAMMLGSCVDSDNYEIKGVTATPSFVFPLAFGELGIKDFLSDEDTAYVHVYDDGLVYLSYEQTLRSQDIHTLLTFPDKSFNQDVALPAGTIAPSASEVTLATLNTTLNFNLDPEELTLMLLKQGKITVSSSIIPVHPANLNYDMLVELPDFTLNGVSFSQRITNGVIDLTGYQAKFNNDVTPIKFTIIKRAHTSSITVPPLTKVHITLAFEDLDYKLQTGFFGDQTAEIPAQTIGAATFSPIDEVTVSFADPRLSFEVVNSYGVPVNVSFATLEARKSGSAPLAVQLNKSNPITVGFPTQQGDSVKTTVLVTNSKQLLDFSPDEFYYKMNVRVNQGLTSGTNFSEDVSELRVRFKAEVPLYGHASDIVLSDTSDFDIDDVEDSEVEALFIKANIINELPLQATLQIYLADENFIIIDSIFNAQQSASIVKASSVNGQGELVSPGEFNQEIPIESSKIDKIFEAQKLIIVARMSTTKNADGSQPEVKFKSDYSMKTKFGVRVDLKVKADL